jgi:PAS domain S-box-containing protein
MENILAVDDETSVLQYLEKVLAAERYAVRTARSGELALASVAAQVPDLILVDVRMPSMDGLELCRRLKANTATAAIPIILISGSTDKYDRVQGLALGAVDFVTKPFQREELVARIRTHLELRRLRANLEPQVALRTAELRDALMRLEREITDRTQVQQALVESEARFRNMADTAPVLIWVSGPDKLCTFFNRAWLNFTGRMMAQELGSGWSESVHPQDLERCLGTYTSSFDARIPFRMEYRLRRYDGEYRWVLDVGVPRVDPGGRFAGYIGSCMDITEVRRSQEESLDSARVASLRVLAGGIAHDFTNFMGSILSTAELAEDELAGHSSAEYIRRIRTVAERAVEIARELMIYAGRDKGHFELVDLSQLVHEMAELLKSSIPKRTVLRTTLLKNLPAIWGNPTHIRQVGKLS